MGTYNKGILGAFSGKVGPVVGASWRGKDVMRSLPRKSKKDPTEQQLMQRNKFAFVRAFITPLSPVTSRYYGSGSGDKTRNNAMMSYTLKEAVTFVDPNFELIYTKVQVSKGDLLGAEAPTVVAGAATSLDFTWVNNSGEGEAKITDKAVIAVYEPISKTTVYTLNGGTRDSGVSNLVLPGYLSGMTVHSWIAFASDDEKKYATSVYLGSTLLP